MEVVGEMPAGHAVLQAHVWSKCTIPTVAKLYFEHNSLSALYWRETGPYEILNPILQSPQFNAIKMAMKARLFTPRPVFQPDCRNSAIVKDFHMANPNMAPEAKPVVAPTSPMTKPEEKKHESADEKPAGASTAK
jgi:hypothetical protein